jgi:hypothetical protein
MTDKVRFHYHLNNGDKYKTKWEISNQDEIAKQIEFVSDPMGDLVLTDDKGRMVIIKEETLKTVTFIVDIKTSFF